MPGQRPRLADPLQPATPDGVPAQLGFHAGGLRWLLVSGPGVQVIDAPITPVPLVRPWYLGLVRHQQKLLGAVDLAGLCGIDVRPLKATERLLVLPEPWNAALRVDRVQGLVDVAPVAPVASIGVPANHATGIAPALPVPESTGPAQDSEVLVDAAGARWHVLDMAKLCTSPEFLHAGLSSSA